MAMSGGVDSSVAAYLLREQGVREYFSCFPRLLAFTQKRAFSSLSPCDARKEMVQVNAECVHAWLPCRFRCAG